jgi:hypothetical protein
MIAADDDGFGSLFPVRHPSARLDVEGAFLNGGRVRLIDQPHGVDLQLDLPPELFALLSLLLLRVILANQRNLTDGQSFVDKELLLSAFKVLFGITDPQAVTKAVCRVRGAISGRLADDHGAAAKAYAHSLLETYPSFGYRASCAALNLRIVVHDIHRLGSLGGEFFQD